MRVPRNAPSAFDGDCPPVYDLDWVRHEVRSSLDRAFVLHDIEGVEVYTGSRIPARSGGIRARCGVVAVWTREGG